MKFIGTDTSYACADGKSRRRIHLDGAASPLAAQMGLQIINGLLPHYSNSHSYVHNSAQISTRAFAWAHDEVLAYLGADPHEYTAIFMGSGCTANINRLARGLNQRATQRPGVLLSLMEHHANDLPHRLPGNTVTYLNLSGTEQNLGAIDLAAAQGIINELGTALNYAAVASVSNVTGISNDWPALAAMVHAKGGLILIDAAQSVAHEEFNFSALAEDQRPDFFVFSGHKLYTPMAPGVLVAKRQELRELSQQNLGGGIVADVSLFDYALLNELPDREQAGTPNIVGAVALAAVMHTLKQEGLERIRAREAALMHQLIQGLRAFPAIKIYGDPAAPRIGGISFNHRDIPQGLFAALLNDYFGIAVRNECFCAHPYVSELLKSELWDIDLEGLDEAQINQIVNQRRGMVRASISHYTNEEDIEALLTAIKEIENNAAQLRPLYQALPDGSFVHAQFRVDWREELLKDPAFTKLWQD